jgi:predicted TIM-barrel fold metal-dependent hydrolase
VTEPLIIDTDTHFTEPADLWESRLPREWGDSVLKVRWNESLQREAWQLGDTVVAPAWWCLSYGSRKPYPSSPATLEDAHVSTYDQSARVAVMDECGVRAAVLYPNVAGLRLHNFVAMPSKEISAAHISVYNDYQLEWARNAPGRFIPMLVVPFWDLPQSLSEIERFKGKGFGGIVMTGAPQIHGQPYMADPYWYPLWEACVDAELSVSFHIASGDMADAVAPERRLVDPPGTALARIATFPFLDNGKYIADLLLSGVPARYPTLKFVSVESGVGWVPFVLESLDYHVARDSASLGVKPFDGMRPSELFHRQFFVNYWFEDLKPWHIDAVGADNILFETDFPHNTCLGPDDVKERLANGFNDLSDDTREKILWRNAIALYGKALEQLTADPVASH